MIADFLSPEHRFLSNFWPAPVVLDGLTYPTVEHAYQAAKTLDAYQRDLIRGLPKPGYAKRAGSKVPLRPDWFEVRLPTMQHLLSQKFAAGSRLAGLLERTDDLPLSEGNHWGDTFWGMCDGQGENHLGRLLMEIRTANRL